MYHADSPDLNTDNKKQLRFLLRARRKQLCALQQKLASLAIHRQAKTLIASSSSRDIGFYFANDGEINPEKLIEHALSCNKRCYLPCINNKQLLEFRMLPKTNWRMKMVRGRYGILTPRASQPSKLASQLDVLFVPLVGFDKNGKRLGMGGGYYDRTFSHMKTNNAKRTKLIGLGHRCQQVNHIPTDKWDITLDKVLAG